MDLPKNPSYIIDGVESAAGLKLIEGEESINVTVSNGADTKRWTLPKELLIFHSRFFGAALNGSFSEANSKDIKLHEDDPRAFSSLIRWMYTGKVEPDPDATHLAQDWVLGDKLGCLAFSDKALLELFEFHQGIPIKAASILFAYEKSVAGSKLRKWALDEFLYFTRFDCREVLNYSAFKTLTEMDDWGRDLTQALLVLGSDKPLRPYDNPDPYMQVLDGGMARALLRKRCPATGVYGGEDSGRMEAYQALRQYLETDPALILAILISPTQN